MGTATERSVSQRLERLYRRANLGIKMDLDVMGRLLERLGNPQDAYGCLHVAGTNGKGSVCAMLDSVLRQAGAHVGLYTSPHLVRFQERIRCDGVCIGDEDLAALLDTVEAAAASLEAGREATFFEFATALAFAYFRSRASLAVIETGMGGRLDATNVISPLVSVISGISLEHTAYLGRTIEEIAGEKAGIVKRGRPVVCGAMPAEARDVVRRAADRVGAPFVDAEEVASVSLVRCSPRSQKVKAETSEVSYGTLDMGLVGAHQAVNLATALAVVDVLRGVYGFDLDVKTVKEGVARAEWPGRFQVVEEKPAIVLDGAHNPGAAEALAATLRLAFPGRPVGLVAGMCSDKDARGFLKCLSSVSRDVWAVPIASERCLNPEAFLQTAKESGFAGRICTAREGLTAARSWAMENSGVVCVTGSLFLVGEILGWPEMGGTQALFGRRTAKGSGTR